MKRFALMFAVVTGLLALWSAPALAHNSLVESAPAKDARLAQAPAEVKLRFLSNVDKSAKLTVTDAGGASAIGTVAVSGKFLSAPFTATGGGTYTVGYELPSDDGHPIKGSFTFVVDAPPPPPSPSVEPAVQTSSAPPAAQQQAATPDLKSEETPWVPYIGGAAVVGLAVGGLLAFLKRRRAATPPR